MFRLLPEARRRRMNGTPCFRMKVDLDTPNRRFYEVGRRLGFVILEGRPRERFIVEADDCRLDDRARDRGRDARLNPETVKRGVDPVADGLEAAFDGERVEVVAVVASNLERRGKAGSGACLTVCSDSSSKLLLALRTFRIVVPADHQHPVGRGDDLRHPADTQCHPRLASVRRPHRESGFRTLCDLERPTGIAWQADHRAATDGAACPFRCWSTSCSKSCRIRELIPVRAYLDKLDGFDLAGVVRRREHDRPPARMPAHGGRRELGGRRDAAGVA